MQITHFPVLLTLAFWWSTQPISALLLSGKSDKEVKLNVHESENKKGRYSLSYLVELKGNSGYKTAFTALSPNVLLYNNMHIVNLAKRATDHSMAESNIVVELLPLSARFVAAAFLNGSITCYNIDTQKEYNTFVSEYTCMVASMAYAPQRYIAAGSATIYEKDQLCIESDREIGAHISIWTPVNYGRNKGKWLRTHPSAVLKGHKKGIPYMTTLGDAELVSASEDRTVKLWDVVQGSCVHTVKHASAFTCLTALSAHEYIVGERKPGLLLGGDQERHLISVQDKRVVRPVIERYQEAYASLPLQGKIIACGGLNGIITLIDLRKKGEVAQFNAASYKQTAQYRFGKVTHLIAPNNDYSRVISLMESNRGEVALIWDRA